MRPIRRGVRQITTGAAVAALYAGVTMLLAPVSFSGIQLRVAEAMTVLPAVLGASVPGLTVGCLLSNVIGGSGVLDVAFGTLATLLAALCSRALRGRDLLVPLPPVLINAVVVACVLHIEVNAPLLFTMLTVGAGQVIACYGIGLPLLKALKKTAALRAWLDAS